MIRIRASVGPAGRARGTGALVAALVALLWLSPACAGIVEGGLAVAGEATARRSADIAAVVDRLRSMAPLRTGQAKGQARRALVIGIDDYEELTDLNKAEGDAVALRATLVDLGFDVVLERNVPVRAFDAAVQAFVRSLKRGDVAFFFFAGHGISLDQRNFLLPADMPALEGMDEIGLERYAVDAQKLVDRIYARGVEIAFVVLDACRDNPFPPEADTRSVKGFGGLARMTPQKGAFVLYSAGVGQKALDRLGPGDTDPNSVFTRTFRPILATPGMPAVEIAKRTQVEVHALAATVPHAQDPAYYDQVVGQFYLRAPRPRLYGLVVGIDDYGGRFSLSGAVNDANHIAAMLAGAGAEKVVTVTNQDVRLSYLDYVWDDLIEDARPGDTLFFTFSGTGYREPRTGSAAGADDRRTVLLLSGSTPVEDYEGIAREAGGGRHGLDMIEPGRKLTDDVFTGWMEKAARKNVNVIVLVDGCHAGGILDREFANVSFFGAVGESDVAIERELDGEVQGLASFVFARALSGAADLNGDGYLTQAELFAFGDQNIFHMSGGRQNPQFYPTLPNSSPGLVLVSVRPQDAAADLARHWQALRGEDQAPGDR
jgi:uncharacterized caspase-like protein